MTDPLADELDRLCAATGFSRNPFWKTWAKLELGGGLAAAAGGLVGLVHGPDAVTIGCGAALVALGGYLALAGHRSHLYQSNNRLAAYLAAVVRRSPTHPGDRT